jgi:hypothetical protein
VKTKNPNPKKFRKDRSVESTWEKTPVYYTGIIKPDNKNKELVIMEFFGSTHVSACWRNNQLCKVGITFLLKQTVDGFVFKDKKYKFKGPLLV